MATRTNTEWIQQYGAYLQRRFPDRSTAKHYVSDLQLFVQAHPDPLEEVTPQEVDTFVDQQRQAGRAPATIKRRVAALKTFYDFLAETGPTPARPNPVSMRRHAGRQPRHLPRDLADDEVQQLLGVLETRRDQALVAVLLYAGLRVGELVTLTQADITVPADAHAPVRLRVLGKGRKERVVYLLRTSYALLEAYLAETPVATPHEPLLRNQRGQPLTIAGVQERLRHYAQRSGVAVTAHRLRHTYGRWLAENEIPVLTLARLLGHASVQTTQVYIDGANPQLRRHYEAAMTRAQTPPAARETPPAEAVGPAPTPGPATVVRQPPEAFSGADWLPEAPAWWRDGCLDWVQHHWLQWKPSRRQAHARTRLRELRIFWRGQEALRPLAGWADLTATDVGAFIQAQLARGLAPKTVKDCLSTLYGVLQYLVQRGDLAQVPRRPELAVPDPLPRHLTPAEVIQLETYLAQRQLRAGAEDWLTSALYYLLAHGGLRLCEVLDLQVGDLDLAQRRVCVRAGKGQHDRVVYLTRKAAQILGGYLETVPHARADLVLSRNHRPLSPQAVSARIRQLGQAAGVADLSAQRLRHTYATLLLNNGMDIVSLRHLMGHENIATTLIYARLADQTIEHQYQAAMDSVTKINSM